MALIRCSREGCHGVTFTSVLWSSRQRYACSAACAEANRNGAVHLAFGECGAFAYYLRCGSDSRKWHHARPPLYLDAGHRPRPATTVLEDVTCATCRKLAELDRQKGSVAS